MRRDGEGWAKLLATRLREALARHPEFDVDKPVLPPAPKIDPSECDHQVGRAGSCVFCGTRLL